MASSLSRFDPTGRRPSGPDSGCRVKFPASFAHRVLLLSTTVGPEGLDVQQGPTLNGEAQEFAMAVHGSLALGASGMQLHRSGAVPHSAS